MSDSKQEKQVGKLFSQFQESREHANIEQQAHILRATMKAPEQSETVRDDVAGDAAEERVIHHYRRFMAQRDPNREEVIAQVTAYAREQHTTRTAVAEHDVAAEYSTGLMRSLFHWPGKLLGKLSQQRVTRPAQSVSGWQMALPALATVGVVFWLLQGGSHQPEPTAVASWNNPLPAAIVAQSGALMESVQPDIPPSTLGFTAQPGKLGSSFELGQSIARLELALSAQSTAAIPHIIKKADNLSRRLGLPLLSSQIDLQEDRVSLSAVSQRWFEKSPQQMAFFQFGVWMETTRFALKLAEMSLGQQALEQQLNSLVTLRARTVGVLQQHPLQQRQLDRLAQTQPQTLKTYAGLQMFKRQLARCIAVFKNP